MARTKPRVTLFHNRSAGDADHDKQELVSAIRAAGYSVSYFDSKKCDIPKVLEKPTDLIAIAGGDGTVRKVALAARPDGPPIAILPLGTANNLANSLKITAPIHELIAGWKDPVLRKFHPIEVEAPWGARRVIEGVGFGVFAQVIDESENGDDKPSPLEARQAIAETIRRAEIHPLDIRIDDAVLSDEIVLLEITTIPLVGPNLLLAPDADPADRLIDLCCGSAAEREQIAGWLEASAPGTPAPLSTRAASHVAISGRFDRVRIDDAVRAVEMTEIGTLTLVSAEEPLLFVVPD